MKVAKITEINSHTNLLFRGLCEDSSVNMRRKVKRRDSLGNKGILTGNVNAL